MPNFRMGMVCFRRGYLRARAARNRHHDDTKPNCTRVRVIGFGSAVRIAFEDVLEEMDVMYQMRHRICSCQSSSMPCSVVSLRTYNEAGRQRRLQRIGQLMRILADTHFTRPYRLYGFP